MVLVMCFGFSMAHVMVSERRDSDKWISYQFPTLRMRLDVTMTQAHTKKQVLLEPQGKDQPVNLISYRDAQIASEWDNN